MKYSIVSATEIAELIRFVNKKVEEGWQPVGGVAVFQDIHTGNKLYQAIVLPE